jgi:hypothetical protein
MALFDQSYTPPGVYTEVVLNPSSAPLNGNARIPVFIGEGLATFAQNNIQLHRGSSSVSDDQIVGQNLSAQVDGTTRIFQLGYFPVVLGDGTGKVTNDTSKVQVTVGGAPVTVSSLNGKTGQITLADIVPVGSNLVASFFFKRTDTLITNEALSAQVPVFASLALLAGVTLSVSIPGLSGDNVSFAMTQAATGAGVTALAAVRGNGSDAISIELRNTDDTIRTMAQVLGLLQTSIETLSAGFLTVSGTSSTPTVAAAALTSTHLSGGAGQNTSNTFKVAHVPVVDGSNGGVVTTDPSKLTVLVNNQAVTIAAVDGQHGLITLSSNVPSHATVTVTYYTNTYQNTSDLLPGGSVTAVQSVGLGPNRSDFIAGVDYMLSDNNISWGASSATSVETATAGFTPFDASVIDTTLVDEKVYLQPLQGLSNGNNVNFILTDSPVDGSGLGVVTDDPTLISVYVGANPISAQSAGAVRVLRLTGASGQIMLLNPPSVGSAVYATYWRTELNDHTYTLTVEAAGGAGVGTYSVADEQGRVAQAAAVSNASVITDENYVTTGIVWPHHLSDLAAPMGAADEVITLTFQEDTNTITTSPATQMQVTIADTNSPPVPRIRLRGTTPGLIAGTPYTVQLVGGPTGEADATALVLTGETITVALVHSDTTTRTWQEVVDLFTTFPISSTSTGQILCSGVSGADLTPQATATGVLTFANGVNAISSDVATRFHVTTSRTQAQANADHLGLTGGATTGGSNGATGYLGQTYIDAQSAVQFTVVDPRNALNYGYQNLPSPVYSFAPGDTLVLTLSVNPLPVGVTSNGIPGLELDVVTTAGMNVGDTASVQTFNKSGNQPNVGEFYYATYSTAKQASDFALKTFTKVSDAYVQYGQPTTTNNRLSLAVYLFNLNGGQQFACIQVPAQVNSPYASDADFLNALTSLAAGLPGGQVADVYVPLSTSATVQQALSRLLITQASPQIKNRSIGFIGPTRFTTTAQIAALAQGLVNSRVIQDSTNAVGISLQGATDTQAFEYAVSGEFVAAGLAGLYCNPANDVATTLTGQKVVGFTRNLNPLDPPTMNSLAAAGVTVLTDVPGALLVRHYKTTDPSSPLTSEPYVVTTTDYVAEAMERNLNQFQGRKMTGDLPSSIAAVGNALLAGWLNNLITAYNPLVVTQSLTDPTTFNIAYAFRPMFSLLYQNVTMTVNLA